MQRVTPLLSIGRIFAHTHQHADQGLKIGSGKGIGTGSRNSKIKYFKKENRNKNIQQPGFAGCHPPDY
jgi:hypothetical protein